MTAEEMTAGKPGQGNEVRTDPEVADPGGLEGAAQFERSEAPIDIDRATFAEKLDALIPADGPQAERLGHQLAGVALLARAGLKQALEAVDGGAEVLNANKEFSSLIGRES